MSDRKRRSQEVEAGDAGEVGGDNMAGILEEFKADLLAKVETGNNALRNSVMQSVFECVNQIDQATQRRFVRQEGRMSDIEKRLDRLEAKGKGNEEKIGALETGLAAAAAANPDPPPLDFDDFDRGVDHTVLTIRAVEAVAVAAVSEAIKPITESMGLGENDFELQGQQPGRAFTLRFTGAPGLASNRATKFMGLQKVDGQWRGVKAKTPTGGESKVFVDRDKNRRTMRGEFIGRKLASVVRERAGGANVFFKKSALSISIGWTPLVKVEVVSPGEFVLRWNIEKAVEMEIDRDEVLAKVKEMVAEPEDRVVWG